MDHDPALARIEAKLEALITMSRVLIGIVGATFVFVVVKLGMN